MKVSATRFISILGAATMLLVSNTSWGAISGDHDFSGQAWNTAGEKCNVCHTPHNAQATQLIPLWNHTSTTETFTLYTSSSLTATDVAAPAGASKACLSCHDGVTAVDSFGGNTGTVLITGDAKLGTSLADDHPVSFTYDAALATSDGGLSDPTTTNSGLGGTIAVDLLAAGTEMECSSCHDVHDDTNGKYLVMANTGSALCTTCHTK